MENCGFWQYDRGKGGESEHGQKRMAEKAGIALQDFVFGIWKPYVWKKGIQ